MFNLLYYVIADLVLQFDYLGETTEGNLHLVQRLQRSGMVQVFGLNSLNDILTVPVEDLAKATQVSTSSPMTAGTGECVGLICCQSSANLAVLRG